ncbi:MAG: thiamine phosphate synthase [Deltaproteobacteria bacterium]|nr:thiamine phosphate synthase [Deltaproteobacteria bacterium]
MDLSQRLAAFERADLYVVITESFCAGRTSLEVLARVLDAGVGIVQLREKDLGGRDLYELALAYRQRTAAAGALLIIDDRLDIAMATGADGVHLGQADLPVAAARRVAPNLVIGVSSHSLHEALAAQNEGAGYVNIGPIFPTATKPHAVSLGPAALSRIAPHLKIPWSTMGGINQGNIAQVVAKGARHPAVMSAVTAAPDVTAAARALREAIISQRSGAAKNS